MLVHSKGRQLPLKVAPVFEAASYRAHQPDRAILPLPSSARSTLRAQARLRLRNCGVDKDLLLNTTTTFVNLYSPSVTPPPVVGRRLRYARQPQHGRANTNRISVTSTTGFAVGDNIVIAARLTRALKRGRHRLRMARRRPHL
jgi:hypothetical protein